MRPDRFDFFAARAFDGCRRRAALLDLAAVALATASFCLIFAPAIAAALTGAPA